MVPLPLPEGLTVHQVWSLTTVQDEFDVTANVVDPAGDAGTFWLGGVTFRYGVSAAWVTVTMTGEIPVTVVVILATRDVNNGLTV